MCTCVWVFCVAVLVLFCSALCAPREFPLFNWVNSEKANVKVWGLSLNYAWLQLKTLESKRAQHCFTQTLSEAYVSHLGLFWQHNM